MLHCGSVMPAMQQRAAAWRRWTVWTLTGSSRHISGHPGSTSESLMPRSATQRQSARAELGALPEWNLADLYPAPESPQLRQDLDRADRDTKQFAGKWRGRLAGLPGGELAVAIAEYEA